MSTMTITDLPMSPRLGLRGEAVHQGRYQANFIADPLNVQFQAIDVENSAATAVIKANAGQGAMNFNFGVSR